MATEVAWRITLIARACVAAAVVVVVGVAIAVVTAGVAILAVCAIPALVTATPAIAVAGAAAHIAPAVTTVRTHVVDALRILGAWRAHWREWRWQGAHTLVRAAARVLTFVRAPAIAVVTAGVAV